MTLRRQNVVRSRVIHGALRTFVALATLAVAASTVDAQQGGASDPHRWAAAITLDLGSIPGDFVDPCGLTGSRSVGSVGGGLAVLFRPRRWVVATVDTRVSEPDDSRGCTIAPALPTQIGPNEFESWDTAFPNGLPGKPFVRNSLHIGVETPPESPWLLRATVGAGTIWTRTRTPFASVAFGGGLNLTGPSALYYWELETSICAERVGQTDTRYRVDSNVWTVISSTTVSHVVHPSWTALHVGLEMPIALHP